MILDIYELFKVHLLLMLLLIKLILSIKIADDHSRYFQKR